jgi:elongation factor P
MIRDRNISGSELLEHSHCFCLDTAIALSYIPPIPPDVRNNNLLKSILQRIYTMYTASDLRKGLKVQIDKEPYVITDFQFTKPGKGQSLYRCKLRNMITGVILDRTYRSGDTFEPANLEERKMQYLYNQEDEFYFMDIQTYEQTALLSDQVGDARNCLVDNLEVDILFFDNRPIGITLPNFVDLLVTQADPWVKGDSVSGDSKPVTLETGYVLRVPPFIEEGIKITVDTRTGEYVTRVKE